MIWNKYCEKCREGFSHTSNFNHTGKFPRVVTIKVEESDELNIETLAIDLTAKVELDQLLLSGVKPEARHEDIIIVVVGPVASTTAVVIGDGVVFKAHGCCNRHK